MPKIDSCVMRLPGTGEVLSGKNKFLFHIAATKILIVSNVEKNFIESVEMSLPKSDLKVSYMDSSLIYFNYICYTWVIARTYAVVRRCL